MNKKLWCTVSDGKSILISDLQKCHLSQPMVSSIRYGGRLQIPWVDSSIVSVCYLQNNMFPNVDQRRKIDVWLFNAFSTSNIIRTLKKINVDTSTQFQRWKNVAMTSIFRRFSTSQKRSIKRNNISTFVFQRFFEKASKCRRRKNVEILTFIWSYKTLKTRRSVEKTSRYSYVFQRWTLSYKQVL